MLFISTIWKTLASWGFVLLALVSATGCKSDQGDGMRDRPAAIEVVPNRAVLTCGQSLPLSTRVTGWDGIKVYWQILEPSGGTVTPTGVYTAPEQPGLYHVMARAGALGVMDSAEIRAYSRPEAQELRADRVRIARGSAVTLTPVFQGGEGLLLPEGIPVTSGVPVEVRPARSQEYRLRVSNAIGATSEVAKLVLVEVPMRTLADVEAPAATRLGSHYVAVLQRIVGGVQEWSSDEVDFVAGHRPGGPAVVFVPKPGFTRYRIKVKVRGGEDLSQAAPALRPDQEALFTVEGSIQPAGPMDPDFSLDSTTVTAGSDSHLAQVINPNPAYRYAWSFRNAAVQDPQPTSARFKAEDGAFLVVTCTATDPATGAQGTASRAAQVVERAQPPVIRIASQVLAGYRGFATPATPRVLETYRWSIDPAMGAFAGGIHTVVGAAPEFTISNPGPFTLRCTAVNLAGDEAPGADFTGTALGRLVLEPPRIQVERLIPAGAAPTPARVENPVPGLSYAWTATGASLSADAGPETTFTPGPGSQVLLVCTATEPATGASASSPERIEVLATPERPDIQGPSAPVLPGTRQAMVIRNFQPGLIYQWQVTNGTLVDQPASGGIFFQAVPGTYRIACTARNRLNMTSEPGVFTGDAVTPPAGAGTGGLGGGAAPGGGGAAGGGAAPGGGMFGPGAGGIGAGTLTVRYEECNGIVGAPIPPHHPVVANATGPVTYRVRIGALPPGLHLVPDDADPVERAGKISGVPTAAGSYVFRIEARDAAGQVADSGSLHFMIGDAAPLTLTYPQVAINVQTRMALPAGILPIVANVIPDYRAIDYSLAWQPGRELQHILINPATGEITGLPMNGAGDPLPFVCTVTATNWGHRVATCDLSFTVTAGPGLAAGYPGNVRITDTDILGTAPTAGIMPHVANHLGMDNQFAADEASPLPRGLTLDPLTGEITGVPETGPGDYQFRIRLTNSLFMPPLPAAGSDTVLSDPIHLRVVPFMPLAVTDFSSDANPIVHGRQAVLNWTFTGIPEGIFLGRNLMDPALGNAPGASAGLQPNLTVGDESPGTLTVPVRRRQTFTLRLTPRTPVDAPQTRSLHVGVQGIDVVAGSQANPVPPTGEFRDGDPAAARLGVIEGIAYGGAAGSVIVSEPREHTLRKFDPATNHWTLFKGWPQGPDEGHPLVARDRLNRPGALTVMNHILYIADVGSHTIKATPLDGSGPVVVVAGRPGVAGNANLAPLTSSFGTIKDLKAQGGKLYVADLEAGIRVVDLAAGTVTTLERGAGGYRCALIPGTATHWPTLTGPVALAVNAAEDRIYVITQNLPGAPARPNHLIQVLERAAGNDEHGQPIHWELGNYTGSAAGAQGSDNGALAVARFKTPTGLFLEGNDLFVVDTGNHAIRRIDVTTGIASTFAGSITNPGQENDGPHRVAKMKRPSSLTVAQDANHFLAVDQDGLAIRTVERHVPAANPQANLGAVLSASYPPPPAPFAGGGLPPPAAPPATSGFGIQARFAGPAGLVVERSTGDAFVVDRGSNSIRRVSLLGNKDVPSGTVTDFAARPSAAPGGLPRAAGGPRAPGEPQTPTLMHAATRFFNPTDIGIDGKARCYVLEADGSRIRRLNRGVVNVFLRDIPVAPAVNGEPQPNRLAVRPGGTDPQLLAVSYRPAGGAWTIGVWRALAPTEAVTMDGAGGTLAPETVDPAGLPAGLDPRPLALAFGLDSRLYAVFRDPARQVCEIRAFMRRAAAPAAWVPVPGFVASAFGPGDAAGQAWGFPEIRGMAANSRHDLFLTDAANGAIWMRRADSGEMALLAGTPGTRAFQDPATVLEAAPFATTPLNCPTGIAVTAQDDVVFTDANAVFQITAPALPGYPYRPPAMPAPAWFTQVEHNRMTRPPGNP